MVRIRTAAELFEGLRHPEPSVKLAVLAAVASQPDRILAYGPLGGVDVVDELVAQLSDQPGLYAGPLLGALARFRDDRVVEACAKIARQHKDAEMIAQAVERLAAEEEPSARATLAELLFSLESVRAIPAARALRARPDLSPGEHMRVELWVGALEAVENQALWLGELGGPLRSRAQRCLERQGDLALDWLAGRFRELDPDLRAWLLVWAGRVSHPTTAGLVSEALEQGQGDLPRIALEVLAQDPRRYPGARELAAGLTRSENPRERALAWRVAQLEPEQDWAELFAQEKDPEVRCSLAQRLAEEPRLDPLLALTGDPDWRLRALAAQGLTTLGSSALEPARQLARSPSLEARAVGARVLVSLGDYEWMEEHLLA